MCFFSYSILFDSFIYLYSLVVVITFFVPMDAGLLCEDKTAAWFYRLFILFCLYEINCDKHKVLIVCMRFDCTLHLSVCCYVDIYALVHIERRVA